MPDYPAGSDADKAPVESGVRKRGFHFTNECAGKSALEKPKREVNEISLTKRLNYGIGFIDSQFVISRIFEFHSAIPVLDKYTGARSADGSK